MVDEVECLGAKLQTSPFVDRERLEQPQVPVLKAWLVNAVADVLRRVKRAFLWRGKDRRAIRVLHGKPLSWVLRPALGELAKNFGIPVDDPILAVHTAPKVCVLADAGGVITAGNAARQASLKLSEAADLPAAEHLPGEIGLAVKEGQLIEVVDHYDMPGVELRRSPQIVRVVGIRDDIPLVGAIIHAFGKRVRQAEQEAVGEAAVPCQLERVIAGTGDIIGFPNGAVAQIRPKGVDIDARIRSDNVGSRLVDISLPLQVQTATAHITKGENRFPEHFPLNGEVPVPRFRVFEGLALSGHYQGNTIRPAPARLVHGAE